jgi:hypothetical protein
MQRRKAIGSAGFGGRVGRGMTFRAIADDVVWNCGRAGAGRIRSVRGSSSSRSPMSDAGLKRGLDVGVRQGAGPGAMQGERRDRRMRPCSSSWLFAVCYSPSVIPRRGDEVPCRV